MKQFFKTINQLSNIAEDLSIPKDTWFEIQSSNLCADKVKASIEKCKDHPSIICIKDKVSSVNNPNFSFNFVSFKQALDEINKLPNQHLSNKGIK